MFADPAEPSHPSTMSEPGPYPAPAVGARLRLLRLALGYGDQQQSEFARTLGIGVQAWNNYENGRRRIDIEQAHKVVSFARVTLDWIYQGSGTLIDPELLRRMNEIERRERDEARYTRPALKASAGRG